MARSLTVVATIATLALAPAPLPLAPLNAAPMQTERAACNRVKTYISGVEHFRVSAIAFCDMIGAADSPTGVYVMALHSNRHCDGICSTNMGSFAVEKRMGRIFEWDLAEFKLGHPLKSSR